MVRQIATAGILAAGLAALPLSLRATQSVEPAVRAGECLHTGLEAPAERARRSEALAFAERVNHAETIGGIAAPGRLRNDYRSFDELRDLPPTPAGFHIQLNTDGVTYNFSLKDTRDPCQYAIFSDQDLAIYEGTPRSGVHILPVGTR